MLNSLLKFAPVLPILALLLPVLAVSTSGQSLTGKRVKITGRWNGHYFDVVRLKERDARKDPGTGRVEGRIDTVSTEKAAFVIGPVVVRYTPQTEFVGFLREDLRKNVAIEATGRIERPGLLIAERIESGDATREYIDLLGVVTVSKDGPTGDVRAKVLGVPVRVPQDVFDRGLSLIRNPDDKRPDRQLTLQLWGRPLIIGGEVGNSVNFRGDYELDDAEKDDLARLDQGIELEFFYRPSRNVSIFFEAKSSREQVVYDEQREGGLESRIYRGEMWIYFSRLLGTPLALQVGRQRFREDREWWWDSDLDAVRLYYLGRRFYAEAAISEELPGLHLDSEELDPEEQGLVRYLGRLSLALHREHRLEGFYLRQRDRSGWQIFRQSPDFSAEEPADVDLTWQGIRLNGALDLRFLGDAAYWIDSAMLSGREAFFDEDLFASALSAKGDDDRHDGDDVDDGSFAPGRPGVQSRTLKAWAIDAGLSIETALPGEPTLTFAYAVGSGDRKATAVDETFRQTGLHDNNSKFNGVDRFRYYGELFRPDLSNIRILTVSIGLPFWQSSSLEVLFHKYWQDALSTERISRLKAKPKGLSQHLGEEVNVVIGLEKWQHFEVEIIGAVFRAGRAYGEQNGKFAYNAIFKIDINF